MDKITPEHEQNKTLTENIIIPEHEERTETPDFTQAKNQLRIDGHFYCWICGTTENIEVHHFWAEWCLSKIVNLTVVKALCALFDIYGYSKKYADKPFESINDIRQMMCLCKKHHTGKGTGIHCVDFVTWIAQKVCFIDPVPEQGQDIEKLEKEISNL